MAREPLQPQATPSDQEAPATDNFSHAVDQNRASTSRPLALLLIAVLFFNFPFLTVVDSIVGAPWTPIILFGGWAGIIIAMAIIMHRGGNR